MVTEKEYIEYLENLKIGAKNECYSIAKNCFERDEEIKEIYENLFQKSLYEIGELWERNKISVATEHIATAITESLLNLAYPKLFAADKSEHKAIISCVANEFHQIGGKMVADSFEMCGWNTTFLGANTPQNDLLQTIHEKKAEVVALSLSIYFNVPNLVKHIESIRHSFPDIEIMIGGQAFKWGDASFVKSYKNVHFIESLNDLEKYILNA